MINTLRPWVINSFKHKFDFKVIGASGSYLITKNNEKILDLTSGAMVTNLGHNHPHINLKMKQTINKGLLYLHYPILTEEREKLSKRLINLSPFNKGKVFYTTGGADANECAIYFLKKYMNNQPKKQRILRFENSFHGASSYIASYLGGNKRREDKHNHFKLEFFNDALLPNPSLKDNGESSLKYIKNLFEEQHQTIASIFIEGTSGTSGTFIYPPNYYKNLENLSREYNIIIIVDEVMSGFGRTGKMFAIDHHKGNPDMITIAKGVTNGSVPMGAVLLSEKMTKCFDKDIVSQGLTYFAHPLACSAANACIDLYEKNKFEILDNVHKNSISIENYLLYLKNMYPSIIRDYRGIGQLYCIEFYEGHIDYINDMLVKRNIYALSRNNYLFIAPPLVIDNFILIDAFEKLDEILGQINSHL